MDEGRWLMCDLGAGCCFSFCFFYFRAGATASFLPFCFSPVCQTSVRSDRICDCDCDCSSSQRCGIGVCLACCRPPCSCFGVDCVGATTANSPLLLCCCGSARSRRNWHSDAALRHSLARIRSVHSLLKHLDERRHDEARRSAAERVERRGSAFKISSRSLPPSAAVCLPSPQTRLLQLTSRARAAAS